MKSKELIESCPFCGWEGKLFSHEMNKNTTLWWVQCRNSHCLARRAVRDSREAAIASWNSRYIKPRRDNCG